MFGVGCTTNSQALTPTDPVHCAFITSAGASHFLAFLAPVTSGVTITVTGAALAASTEFSHYRNHLPLGLGRGAARVQRDAAGLVGALGERNTPGPIHPLFGPAGWDGTVVERP